MPTIWHLSSPYLRKKLKIRKLLQLMPTTVLLVLVLLLFDTLSEEWNSSNNNKDGSCSMLLLCLPWTKTIATRTTATSPHTTTRTKITTTKIDAKKHRTRITANQYRCDLLSHLDFTPAATAPPGFCAWLETNKNAKQIPLWKRYGGGRKTSWNNRSDHNGRTSDDDYDDDVVSVIHWPAVELGFRTAAQRHVFENGIFESPHLKMANKNHYYYHNSVNVSSFGASNPSSSSSSSLVVWIGEPGQGCGWKAWCTKFTKVVKRALVERFHAGDWLSSDNMYYYIVDFTDRWESQNRCRPLERLVGRDRVQYFARGVGTFGRHWNATTLWIQFGTTRHHGKSIKKTDWATSISFAVRTDIVKAIQDELQRQEPPQDLDYPIEHLPRHIDVAHFWPLDDSSSSPSSLMGKRDGNFRTRISRLLHFHGNEMHLWNTTLVRVVGQSRKAGRLSAQQAYVRSMLQSKIIVVTQRDLWRDHYRLMEALVSGALVVSDDYYLLDKSSLPEGLKNGSSLLLFQTPQELKSLLVYYLAHDEERLAIAKLGRQVAMSRHRSWHRMEEIIFGRVLTTCVTAENGDSSFSDMCPYTVHAPQSPSAYLLNTLPAI